MHEFGNPAAKRSEFEAIVHSWDGLNQEAGYRRRNDSDGHEAMPSDESSNSSAGDQYEG